MKYARHLLYVVLLLCSQIHAASPNKKTICLNMIVKNESQVINRCLQSVLPIIDTWVIVDTGSTDGTQKIIKEYLKDVPGELHERPWVNFGHNRQEALELAYKKADYILFMDADDILVFANDFSLPELNHDFYVIPTHQNGLECLLPRLISSKIKWHWEGVLHEYINPESNANGSLLKGVEYVYITDGARSKDPQRYLKDIEILKTAIQQNPSNPRNVFYLAKTYQQAGDLENALKAYLQRSEMGGFPEEVFDSKLQVAKIQEVNNLDSNSVNTSYINAYKYRPSRVEPLFYLTNKIRKEKNFQKAYDIALLAITMPSTDSLFVEKWMYDFGMLGEYALCAFELQKYPECIQACNNLLANQALPENYRKDVQNLLQKATQQNQVDIQKRLLEILEK